MKFVSPAAGQDIEIGQTVHFRGTAETTVVRVSLLADKKFNLPDATITLNPDGTKRWVLDKRLLQVGQPRLFEAIGFAEDGTEVARASLSINIVPPHLGDYTPPSTALEILGEVISLLEDVGTKRLKRHLTTSFSEPHEAFGFLLPNGEFYLSSDLDLDTDGSIFNEEHDTHQDDTSLHDKEGNPIDANAVPFFVLPGRDFARQIKMKLGDVGLLICPATQKHSFAIYADNSEKNSTHVDINQPTPTIKTGEGSIALHRELGFERIHGNHVTDVGIDPPIILIAFPGSGSDWTNQTHTRLTKTVAQVLTLMRAKGKELYKNLSGNQL